jgi:hypothetical protein
VHWDITLPGFMEADTVGSSTNQTRGLVSSAISMNTNITKVVREAWLEERASRCIKWLTAHLTKKARHRRLMARYVPNRHLVHPSAAGSC